VRTPRSGRSKRATHHDDAHGAFMTLAPYTGTREGEARQLGSGPLSCGMPSILLVHGRRVRRYLLGTHNIPLVGVVDRWLGCWLPGNQIRKNSFPPLWDYRHYRGWPRRRISCRAGDRPLASQYHARFLCHDTCRFPGGCRPPGNRALCCRARGAFENEFVVRRKL